MFWIFRKGSSDPGCPLCPFVWRSSLFSRRWAPHSCGWHSDVWLVNVVLLCTQTATITEAVFCPTRPTFFFCSLETLVNPPAPARLQERWTFDLVSTGSVPAVPTVLRQIWGLWGCLSTRSNSSEICSVLRSQSRDPGYTNKRIEQNEGFLNLAYPKHPQTIIQFHFVSSSMNNFAGFWVIYFRNSWNVGVQHPWSRVTQILNQWLPRACEAFINWLELFFFSDLLGEWTMTCILIYSDILSEILPGMYSDILSDIFSNIQSDILPGILSDIPSDIYFDIFSGIRSGIPICHILAFYLTFYLTYSHILFDILPDILSGILQAFYLAFYVALCLTFSLAFSLTFYLAFDMVFYLAVPSDINPDILSSILSGIRFGSVQAQRAAKHDMVCGVTPCF